MRLLTIAVSLVLLGLVGGSAGATPGPARVAIFFYPWYGTPAHDGAYQHWKQNGSVPPSAIASSYYPARGLYSSSDPRVLAAQMREIAAAGIDQVVVSWWGWGSPEDERLPAVIHAARARGIDVAVHLEPYEGRTPAGARPGVDHLRRLGVRDLYVYGPHDAAAADWGAVTSVEGMRFFAQTGLVGFAATAGFHGVYTYDILTFGGQRFARLCEQARRKGLVCAPSVGPGYDARRAVADTRTKSRRNGATYDAMWSAALAAGADAVTITSYNEWHEGSQIEPARRRSGGYADYEGAWGRRGAAAERAYLDRTAFWVRSYGP
jgi:hypothetical protein